MKKIIRLDASALVKSACKLRLKMLISDGLKSNEVFNDTLYGSAFHLFCKMMFTTNGNFAEATTAALSLFNNTPCTIRKKHLTSHHLVKTCHDYWLHFAQKDDFEVISIENKPLVEQTFSILLRSIDEYDLYLEGTIDKIGKFKNGIVAVGDYKTHSLWSLSNSPYAQAEAIKEYFRKFELSLQLHFYVFCLKLLSFQYPDHPLSNLLSKQVGIFIDGVFLDSKKPTVFERSNVYLFDENTLAKFENMLYEHINTLLPSLLDDSYSDRDGILKGACSDGNFICQFFNICANQNDTIKKLIIKDKFTYKPYEPLTHGK